MKDAHSFVASTRRHDDPASDTGPGPAADGGGARERGFALLVSLIAIVGLTALATGGLFLANSERQTSANHHAATEAYHLANAGLAQHMGVMSGTPTVGVNVAEYDYPESGGDARVSVERVGATDGGDDMYRVSSLGRFRPDGPGKTITRTVATVAVRNTNVLPKPNASVTSGGGITKNGNSGKISGFDDCGVEGDRAAVTVPTDPGYDGKDGPLEGDPLVDTTDTPFDFLQPGAEEWWNGMLDGTTTGHDFTLKADDSSSQWPDFSGIGGMPTTYVDKNNIELGDNQDGQGLLIIKGNATFKGNFDWDGVILVGGSVTDHGQGQIRGAVMTGLNVLKGEDVSQDDLEDVDTLDGTKKYLYNSCIIEQVQNATATIAQVPGTWHEQF